jgi:type IV fimbrial biogenesis protein FimT
MHNHILKPERAVQDGSPFICHKVPFVCGNNSFIIPFVGLNKPSVGFEQNLSGFSLIELLVTLSVVSILAFVAVPSIKNILKDHGLSGYTNDLVADLNAARSEAVKRATPVTICKTSNPQNSSPTCNTTAADNWTTGRITFVDADSDGVIDAGEQVLRIRQGLDDQNCVIKGNGVATGTANRVTFKSDGTSTLTADTEIALCDDRGATQKRAVAINVGGRIRTLQKGTSTITCP